MSDIEYKKLLQLQRKLMKTCHPGITVTQKNYNSDAGEKVGVDFDQSNYKGLQALRCFECWCAYQQFNQGTELTDKDLAKGKLPIKILRFLRCITLKTTVGGLTRIKYVQELLFLPILVRE